MLPLLHLIYGIVFIQAAGVISLMCAAILIEEWRRD